ncbi:39S ribosomal protein L22, mitochondrial [Vermiconidia calcicola]|uniref:39S ribosomal protein L22, mitochondrial n=1 Tax=Vermiconidia calcicola TaxID=1690605 RepID=A0ACC3MN61_9PEZI|nr:39S ribosomal protein L22, mitochondrial [Vermiconidia calcicola]
MSLPVPSWRSAPRHLFYNASSLPIRIKGRQARWLSQSARRRAVNDQSGGDGEKKPNPILDEYLRKNPTAPVGQDQLQARPAAGDIAASSIFEDDRRAQEQAQRDAAAKDGDEEKKTGGQRRDPRNMQRVLDPDPNARERWERKKVIQMVKRGGRLSKTQFIKRTEREHLVKSQNMKTSVKKLGMLARQIAGKNIDDAITQMRFSKKKVALDVMKQLEFARDEAVVMRGMGLSQGQPEENADNLNDTSVTVSGTSTPMAETKKRDKALDIQLKDGKRHRVDDRSQVYIDQAWVGRGPYGKLPDYRARGRVYVMRTPWTSLSLLLKEEATRIREYAEREAKRRKQKIDNVWVPLPDRPIQTKSQWYSW